MLNTLVWHTTRWHLADYFKSYFSFDKYWMSWNPPGFLHVCGIMFFQLWLAYLEFLSPLLEHRTCIFNQYLCWPRQDWNVSAIVCTWSITGLWLQTVSVAADCAVSAPSLGMIDKCILRVCEPKYSQRTVEKNIFPQIYKQCFCLQLSISLAAYVDDCKDEWCSSSNIVWE